LKDADRTRLASTPRDLATFVVRLHVFVMTMENESG